MVRAATVPVEVTPEAVARAKELGLERELQEVIEHTLQTIPDLRSVEVSRYDDLDESRILIWAWLNSRQEREVPVWEEWTAWCRETYPPDVGRWFSFDAVHWDNYGR